MSTLTMILGESGAGKSTSLRNMAPEDTLLIQAVRKTLPFKAAGWTRFSEENKTGNIFVADTHDNIITLMRRTRRKVIVLDDFQYVMANEFMRRSDEKGFEKFTEIGRHAWDILTAAANLPDDVRVYVLSHTETSDAGRVKIKTIGKMLDEKITLEGMVTICLRAVVRDGEHQFSVHNSGQDTTKSPLGMFDTDYIPNDLAAVDQSIVAYYDLAQPA